MVSLELSQTRRRTVDSLFRVLILFENRAERLQVRLRLLQLRVQGSETRTRGHQKVDVTHEHERKHETTASKRDHFSDAEHLAAT
jgi:hypothetical protein